MAKTKSAFTDSGSGTSKTLAKAEEGARADYTAGGEETTKGRAGRKDPEVGKSGDKNIQQH